MSKALLGDLRVGVKTIAVGLAIGLLVISCGCVGKGDASEPIDATRISNTASAKNDSVDPKPPPEDTKIPVAGGCTFSSDLPLEVFIMREPGGERERIGETRSGRPLNIPRCVSWEIRPIGRIDMNALAREIAENRIPELDMGGHSPGVTDDDLVHLKGLTELQELRLSGTMITGAGRAELRKALPKADIR